MALSILMKQKQKQEVKSTILKEVQTVKLYQMIKVLLLAFLLLLSNTQLIQGTQDPAIDPSIDPTIDPATTDPTLSESTRLPWIKQVTMAPYLDKSSRFYSYQSPQAYTLKEGNILAKSSKREPSQDKNSGSTSAHPSSQSYAVSHKNVMLKPITIYVPVDNSDFEEKHQTPPEKSNLRTSNP